jgi:hypothetical protein
MVLHPYSNLRKIQGLDRLPDRRVSKGHQTSRNPYDPLRGGGGQSQAIYQALGLYGREESRIGLYENYREMDYDSIISGVIDAFGEDASQLDPEHGRVVWCSANNSDIQQVVTRCLDRTQQDHKAFPTIRQLGLDGDVFTHPAAARGKGVIALKAYEPWQVARIEDEIGRLVGFSPSDDRGEPTRGETNSVPFWKVLHYRLPSRNLTDIYGAKAGLLWGARTTWRELQLMLDQVVMQRLLRRPDRLMVLVDTVGMSHDDAHWFIEDLKRRMHREWHLNPSGGSSGFLDGGAFQSTGLPTDGGLDFVLARGPNNGTEVTNFPATNQNDLLRDVEMFFKMLAKGVGFPDGYIGMAEGRYNPEQSLSRQHQPFAKRASRLQRAYLQETVRMCMIDMAYQGLDPTRDENHFSLHMAPVSPILEIERHEVTQMKIDRLERALRLGLDNQFPMDFWVPFVLRTYGDFPDDVVQALYPGKAGSEGGDTNVGSDAYTFESGNGKRGRAAPDRKVLEETLRTLTGAPIDSKPMECATNQVIDADMFDTQPLRGGLALHEWRKAGESDRAQAAPGVLVDTTRLSDHIINSPAADAEASAKRTEQAGTRQKVMEGLVLNGKIMELGSVGSYGGRGRARRG